MIALPMDSKGKYTKFPQGKTKLRFLTEPMAGFQVWIEDENGRRPVRCKAEKKTIDGIEVSIPSQVLPQATRPDDYQKFILVSLVWNYNTEQIEVFVVDKATIWKPLAEYNNNEDWGSPTNYDITITKVGEGRDTTYSVIASPAKALDKQIADKFKSEKESIDLEKIFTGENPFGVTSSNTEMVIDPDDLPY